MTTTRSFHLQEFTKFWQNNFPNQPVPALPADKRELSLSVQMVMRDSAPQLWQNLFANSGKGSQTLPADVELRRQQGSLLPSDEEALLNADLDIEAARCRKFGEEIEQLRTNQQIEDGRKEFLAAQKRAKQWSEAGFTGRLAVAPPTPQSVAAARKAWGITEE